MSRAAIPQTEVEPPSFRLSQVAAVLVSMVALGFWGARYFYHDDAMISLRYARNLLAGDGLVWNPGEYVEGYTNFLFLLSSAGLGWTGLDLRIATRVLGVTSYVVVIALTVGYLWTREADDSRTKVSLSLSVAAFVLIGQTSMFVWSLGGLEAVTVGVWLTAGAICFLRFLDSGQDSSLVWAGSFFAIAALTRLDSLIFPAVTAGLLLAEVLRGRARIRSLVSFLAPALILVPYGAWKLSYYGDLLPNTFYVKAGTLSLHRIGMGFDYLWRFLTQAPLIYPLIALLWLRNRVRLDRRIRYLLVVLIVHAAYVVYVGGDHMPAHRLFVPVLPCATIALFFLLVAESRDARGRFQQLVASIAAIVVGVTFVGPLIEPVPEDEAAFLGRIVGDHISHSWPDGSLVALNTAGSTPYFSPRQRFIDMLGLNDAHIARRRVKIVPDLEGQQWPGHEKGDGAYVLRREPDYLILGHATGQPAEYAWFLTGHELSKTAEFHERYELKRAVLDATRYEHHERYEESIFDGQIELLYYQKR